MKRSVKGALLSGLIMPGLGQLWLKQYWRGAALVLAVSLSLALVVVKALQQAVAIVARVEAAGGTLDLVAITAAAREASSASNDIATLAATIVLAFCWVVGVVDAYASGARADQAEGDEEGQERRLGMGAEEENS